MNRAQTAALGEALHERDKRVRKAERDRIASMIYAAAAKSEHVAARRVLTAVADTLKESA